MKRGKTETSAMYFVLVIVQSSSPQSKIKGHTWQAGNQLEFENSNL